MRRGWSLRGGALDVRGWSLGCEGVEPWIREGMEPWIREEGWSLGGGALDVRRGGA